MNSDLVSSPFWRPYTGVPSLGPAPVELVRAQGAYIYDRDGKGYFDGTSSWWSVLHGHCHPRLVRALKEQSETLCQILPAPHAHPKALALAKALCEVAGAPFEKVFFSDNGSTAVECALKQSLQFWSNLGFSRKKEFISLDCGYHGDTLGALSLGSIGVFQKPFEQAFRVAVRRVPTPYAYRNPLSEEQCLDEARKVFERFGETTAALIVEPLLLGAGGMITYSKEYLNELVREAHRHQIHVIFDEVFTAFGRLGSWFACHQIDERPDFICLSKGLTAGMLPMGATLTTQKIFAAFTGGEDKKFYHGHTFTANALGCAVALESLELLRTEHTFEKNARLKPLFEDARERFLELAPVGDVRTVGMVWAAELVEDKKTKAMFHPPQKLGWKIAERVWKEGWWIRPMGAALYLVPPYCTTESEIKDAFDALAKAVGEGV